MGSKARRKRKGYAKPSESVTERMAQYEDWSLDALYGVRRELREKIDAATKELHVVMRVIDARI